MTFKLRSLFWKIIRTNLCLPLDSKIGTNTYFSNRDKIVIGEKFFCGQNCYFSGNIVIGKRTLIASYVSIVGGDHKIDHCRTEILFTGRDNTKTTIIKDDVWIGHGAVIMNGVTIGKGAVVGASSVVTKDIPSLAVYVGNPAKFLRYRKINETSSSIS